eukprot:UN22873
MKQRINQTQKLVARDFTGNEDGPIKISEFDKKKAQVRTNEPETRSYHKPRERGRVYSFNMFTGYGWLQPDDGSDRLFAYFRNIICSDESKGGRYLTVGEEVEYEIVPSKAGENHMQARHITKPGREKFTFDRVLGTVDWFDSRRGIGFINPESGGEQVFVNAKSIIAYGSRFLIPGTQVE